MHTATATTPMADTKQHIAATNTCSRHQPIPQLTASTWLLPPHLLLTPTHTTADTIYTAVATTPTADTTQQFHHLHAPQPHTHQLHTHQLPAGHAPVSHIPAGLNRPLHHYLYIHQCQHCTTDAVPSYYVTMPDVTFPNHTMLDVAFYLHSQSFSYISLIFYSLTFVPTSIQ